MFNSLIPRLKIHSILLHYVPVKGKVYKTLIDYSYTEYRDRIYLIFKYKYKGVDYYVMPTRKFTIGSVNMEDGPVIQQGSSTQLLPNKPIQLYIAQEAPEVAYWVYKNKKFKLHQVDMQTFNEDLI